MADDDGGGEEELQQHGAEVARLRRLQQQRQEQLEQHLTHKPRMVDVPVVVDAVPCQRLMMTLNSIGIHRAGSRTTRAAADLVTPVAGYRVRTLRADSVTADRRLWAEVQISAQMGRRWRSRKMADLNSEEQEILAAMKTFDEEFGAFLPHMSECCFFVEEVDTGQVVATAIAWHGEMCGEMQGRMHWLAVRSSHHGGRRYLPGVPRLFGRPGWFVCA